jgi:rubrerythrin
MTVTLTPTIDVGATTKESDLVYAPPAAGVTDEMLSARIAIPGMNAAFLADTLSAILTHERCGTHLYRMVAARTNNPMLKRKYEEFGEETERHVEILERLITSSGGNPNYVSPKARAVEGMDSKLVESTFALAGSLDPMLAETVMLDAVFVAECVDHANWQTLGQIAKKLPAGEHRDAFERAVDEVEADEDEHLTWATQTRERLTMLQVESNIVTTAGVKLEEAIATVKSWFG